VKSFGTATLKTDHAKGRVWVIDAKPSVMMRLKRLFMGADRQGNGKHIVVADTLETCRDLAWVCERWPLEVTPRAYLDERTARHVAAEEAIDRILAAGYTPREFEMALRPRDYQRVAAELALSTRQLLVADDLGLGKTATAICAITDPSMRPALVVTLTHLPRQWENELTRFVPGLRVHRIRDGALYNIAERSTRTRKRRTATGAQATLGGLDAEAKLPDVIVTSYSKLAKWGHVLAGLVKSVVFDEVQELRRHESTKYQSASAIARGADARIGLSATPVYNYGGEVYNVLDVLAPGVLGTWTEFSASWCKQADADRNKAEIKDPRALGAWMLSQGLMVRRTRSEVGRELPEVSRIVHTIEHDASVIDAERSTAERLASIILGTTLTSGRTDRLEAAAELDWRLRQATGIAKAPYVADFVSMVLDGGEPSVVVYAWHHAVYDVLAERLKGYGVARYTGEQSNAQKEESKRRFTSGEDRVLLMSLRAGAGLDGLQAVCRTVVFAELDWSPGVHEQAIGRVHRDGQGEPVAAYYLTSEDGSDPVVIDVLGVKATQVEGVRNPHLELPVASQVDPERMKRLAERYLSAKAHVRHEAEAQVA